MTGEDLRRLVQREPFEPFTVHLNDGSRLRVGQPDDIFAPRRWRQGGIVVMDNGRFSFFAFRNIAHVSTRGSWPKLGGRKRRNGSGEDDS